MHGRNEAVSLSVMGKAGLKALLLATELQGGSQNPPSLESWPAGIRSIQSWILSRIIPFHKTHPLCIPWNIMQSSPLNWPKTNGNCFSFPVRIQYSQLSGKIRRRPYRIEERKERLKYINNSRPSLFMMLCLLQAVVHVISLTLLAGLPPQHLLLQTTRLKLFWFMHLHSITEVSL